MSNSTPTPNAVNSGFEPLTPLDVLMPKTYIGCLLAFRTSEPLDSVLQRLQSGLDATTLTLPWISGRICPAAGSGQQAAHGGIQYSSPPSPPLIADKGSISEPISSLAAHSMQSTTIPEGVWPLGPLPQADSPFVFGASIFRFKDNEGVGLCVMIHHNAVDAAGFTEVLRVWAKETAAMGSSGSPFTGSRLSRMSEALASEVKEASLKDSEQLFGLLPEYSPAPPSMPSSFPSFASKIFTIPAERLDACKMALEKHLDTTPSTNTILCTLLWSSITRMRAQHQEYTTAPTSSRLIMAVNGRRRIDPSFCSPENPYLGNLIIYSSAESPFDTLQHATTSGREQADICNAIAQSCGPAKINRQHIANVFELGRNSGDGSTVFPGWDLFNHKDLTITSWADLDLYEIGWGSGLGQPEFVRVPFSSADGVCIVMPRKRGQSTIDAQEVIEVLMMLKEEHMEALKADEQWRNLIGAL